MHVKKYPLTVPRAKADICSPLSSTLLLQTHACTYIHSVSHTHTCTHMTSPRGSQFILGYLRKLLKLEVLLNAYCVLDTDQCVLSTEIKIIVKDPLSNVPHIPEA